MTRKNKTTENKVNLFIGLRPAIASLGLEGINFLGTVNLKRAAFNYLALCNELRGRIIMVGHPLGDDSLGIRDLSALDQGQNVVSCLYKVEKIHDVRSILNTANSPANPSTELFLNLLIHLFFGWHRQIEALQDLESLSIREVLEKLKDDRQYYELLTSRNVREVNPFEYFIKRSGWMLPGHFGAKSGG